MLFDIYIKKELPSYDDALRLARRLAEQTGRGRVWYQVIESANSKGTVTTGEMTNE